MQQCDCLKILEAVEDMSFDQALKQIEKCEECVYKKAVESSEENASPLAAEKLKVQTYESVRLRYVQKFWELHKMDDFALLS